MTIITTHPIVTVDRETNEITAVAGRLRLKASIQLDGYAWCLDQDRNEVLVTEENGKLIIKEKY